MRQDLFEGIEAKTDELVVPTRALIGFTTVNPPGEGYAPRAEHRGRGR